MSALHAHPESRVRWIAIDTAAALLGKSEGHLRRQCPQLMAKGQATKILVSGAHKWHIATSYSPRLARQAIETDTDTLADGGSDFQEILKTTTAAKLDRAQTDALILIDFRKLRTGSGNSGGSWEANFESFKSAMTEKHGRCPGKSRLYDMDKQCPPSSDSQGIVVSLIDRRGRRTGDIKCCSDAAWQMFCNLYLTQNQWAIAKCYRTVRTEADAQGWAWPSHSRVKQLVRKRLDPSTITLKREGRDAWNRNHLAPMEQDPNAWDAGQCWEGDHSVLDFHIRLIRSGKWVRTRPQLTAWLDRRTRRLMGYCITEQGNANTIRVAMLNGLKDHSISAPDIVWIDNGKDFMAQSITGMTKSKRRTATKSEKEEAQQSSTGLLNMLGIKAHFATPYNHNGKARIERFFGTVHGEFDKEFPSYSGYKPGMLDHRDQLKMQKDVLALPTLEDVCAKFQEWAKWYNARSEHHIDDLRDPDTLERLSPDEFYDRFLPSKRIIDKNALKLLEPVWSTPLKVSKHGVTLRFGRGTVRYGEMVPELEALVGTDQRVFVSWNPDDTGQVSIWSTDFKLICTAMENGRYGGLATDRVTVKDRQAAWTARREQKRRAKAKVDFLSGSLSEAESASRATRDREVQETKARMAEFDRDRDPNDMPSMRLVHTRLDDAPKDIEEQQHRMAAGAETVDPEEDYGSLIDAITEQYNPQPSSQDDFEDESIFSLDQHTQPTEGGQQQDEEYGDIFEIDNNMNMPTDEDECQGMRLVDHI